MVRQAEVFCGKEVNKMLGIEMRRVGGSPTVKEVPTGRLTQELSLNPTSGKPEMTLVAVDIAGHSFRIPPKPGDEGSRPEWTSPTSKDPKGNMTD